MSDQQTPGGANGGFAGHSGARSASRYGDPGLAGFISRSFAKSMGFSDEDLRKPVIGIAQTWSEFNNCHQHFKELAEAVKRGVWQAGGLPLEFPTISLGEIFLSPTSMFFRNLMAIDTEEMIRAQPMNGVVLLGACEAYWTEYRAGTINDAQLGELEDSLCRSDGHCTVMGTASTMSSACEALGIALPGSAAIPAPDARRFRAAEATGKRIVQLVEEDLRPSKIMTRKAFENAIRLMMALGGSTNAVVHLLAVAGRLNLDITLDDFDRLARETPLIGNIRPSGTWQMEQLFEAGGIPAVMKELLPLLHGDCITVTGKTIAENVADAFVRNRDVISPLDAPLSAEGGLAILRGNLAPDGCVIKHAAATEKLLTHRGRAVVFKSVEDVSVRIDDPSLDVTPDSVLVMQNGGPIGAPGMPEAGNIPIPKKLLDLGIRDMVRISDARMSGTAYGTVVLHVAPESAVGGPLALVQDGDWIELDVPNRRLTLEVSKDELAARRAAWMPPERAYARGWGKIYVDSVMQADRGADLSFLLPEPAKVSASR